MLDATAQAELVRSGAASPLELVDAAIARVEALDPLLHALTTERFERARADAASPDLPDGPFRGVPFLLKDLGCPMAGEPAHEGNRLLKELGNTADHDAAIVRRFRAAGLVVLGRTSTPEFGILPTTEPHAYGPTHNPWDVGRSPGGSSGGSAAAVAAGMVPFAHATDGGGSIRIPASCCGLVGLKPTRGRVSTGPVGGELRNPLHVRFAVTRSVRDAAALLDAVAGEEPGDPIVPAPPPRPYAELAREDPPALRVGIMTVRPVDGGAVGPECAAAAEAVARTLESLGHTVELSHPAAYDEPDAMRRFAAVWSTNQAVNLEMLAAIAGREITEADVEPLTWALAVHGREVTAVAYADAVTEMQSWSRRFVQWWADGFDLLLTPTLAELPLPLGTLDTPDEPFAAFARSGPFTPFTSAMNQTGQPAISLPTAQTAPGSPDGAAAGLPVGTHLVAAPGRDDLLLQVAVQLEAAMPWADRRAPVG